MSCSSPKMAAASDDPAPPAPLSPLSPAFSPTFSPSPSSPEMAVKRRASAAAADHSSIRKAAAALFSVTGPAAFERLPDEIIQQCVVSPILLAVDANAFASLALLNRKWRLVAQQADLYVHHLARSPSYAASHKTFLARLAARRQAGDDDGDDDGDGTLLRRLRRDFAREAKRNRFDAYLRPRRTLVRLVSNSISASSCPGGEGMLFQASPKGHHLLAYNSSRIYVLDLRGPAAVEVRRELKILRRPAALCILDDASTLAVLLTAMQVDLYDLRAAPPRRTQSILLAHSPRAIALSPCGSVLAAAYDGGIEVSSLGPGAMDTDRRAVKCDPVDTLAFSYDGTQILGTTVHAAQPNTVILTAPYYDPGSHGAGDDMGALWTTSILFPNTSRDCGHAVLLQDSAREEAFWTFAYDRSFETFRAVRIDDLRNGTTYFTGPIPTSASQARLLPCTLPSASYHGDLVAAGFQHKDVWLYGVPEDLDAIPDHAVPDHAAAAETADGAPGSLAHGSSSRASGSPSIRAASTRLQDPANNGAASVRVPQWQLLCDKLRNTFVAGHRVGELPGMSMVKWVEGFGGSSLRERLVVCARGVSPPRPISSEGDDMDFIDGGRLLLVDFDYGLADGTDTEITIEVGTVRPEELEEEHRDLDTEVAIVRRRTVAQKRGSRGTLMRAATTASSRSGMGPTSPSLLSPSSPTRTDGNDDDDDPLRPRRIGVPPLRRPDQTAANSAESAGIASAEGAEAEAEAEAILEQEALDVPYSHASPRSGMTLRRAATAAANNRRLHPQPATTSSGAPITYRRADGRREHPHESDADNWVPPPPPYQKEDPQDLPAFMRHHVAPIAAPGQTLSGGSTVPTAPAAAIPFSGPLSRQQRPQSFAGQATGGRPGSRPVSLLSTHSEEDLYDATPRPTPRPTPPPGEQSPGTPQRATESNAGAGADAGAGASAADLPPLLPSLSSAASWNVTAERPAQDQGPYVPKPLENVHTWPKRQPSVSTRGSGLRGGQPRAATDLSARLASETEQQSPRRVSVAGFQVPRVPVSQSRQSWRPAAPAPAPAPAAEDRPLIISTPQGLAGAFDAPTPGKSDRQQDTLILAPVPRHPQAQERSSILRDRLETMSGGGNAGQEQQQQQQASATTATRQSSLGRRLSRAERSAAKNIADAKKRGWRRKNSKTGRKGKEVADTTAAGPSSRALSVASLLLPPPGRRAKRKQGRRRERDFDVASSAAWTDITVASVADGTGTAGYPQHGQRWSLPPVSTGPDSSSAYAMQQMQIQQQQYYEQQRQQQQQQQGPRGKNAKNAKCSLM